MDGTETAAALMELGAATLGESGALAMPARMRPVWPGAALAAPAFPVTCTPGDNLAVHVAVTRAPAGSALIVDVGDVAERGYWGEVLTTAAQSKGLAGLVIDGGVRDLAALERLAFPVFSATVALRGATKSFGGAVGTTATVAGVTVECGDWVVGDVDGVVIVPGEWIEEIVTAGQKRTAREAGYFAALRGGETTVDLLDLDASLVEDGSAPA